MTAWPDGPKRGPHCAQRRVGTPVNAPGKFAGPAGNQAPAGVEATDPAARGRAERMAAQRALRRQGKP